MSKVKIIELSQTPATPESGKQIWYADFATKLPAVINSEGKKTILGLTDIAEAQILYVGKHGNDSNTGVNKGRALLTLEEAMIKAAALNPGENNHINIKIPDGGIYTLSGLLTILPHVGIHGMGACIVGNVELSDHSDLEIGCHRGVTSAGGLIRKTTGTDVAHYTCHEVTMAEGNYDFMVCSSGVFVADIQIVKSSETAIGAYVTNSGAGSIVKASFNHVDYDGSNIFAKITGVGSDTGIYVNCVHAYNAGIGFQVTQGSLSLVGGHFGFKDVGSCNDPGVVFINFAKIEGTDVTGDGKVSGLTKSKWAFQRADYNSVYGKRACQAISSNGSGNFTFFIPPEAVEILGIYLIGIVTAAAAGSSKDIDLSSEYSEMGSDELKDHHSESDTTTVYDLTGKTDKTIQIDVSGVFSEVAANDSCGLLVDHQSIGGTIYYLGVGVEYTT